MNWLPGALLGAATLLAAFVLAELITRGYLRKRAFFSRYRPFWREDRHVDTAALPQLPPVARVEVNCDGERGGPPPSKNERAFRALVVGGSAAECYFLDQGATWPAVVERIMSRPENLQKLGVDRVHIGNIARSILPCQYISVMLDRVLPRYDELDAIFIMVGASDIVAWMERGTPAQIDEQRIPMSSVFEVDANAPYGFQLKKSALWFVVSHLNRRFRRPIITTKDGGAWLNRVRPMREKAARFLDEAPDPSPMFENFAKYFRRVVEASKKKAKRVIVVRQPWLEARTKEDEKLLWNFGLGRPYKEEVKTYFTYTVVDRLMQVIDQRAATIAAELGVECVNLSPRLDRSARSFYDELHLTVEGAAQTGQIVAEAVLAPLSPKSPKQDAIGTESAAPCSDKGASSAAFADKTDKRLSRKSPSSPPPETALDH